MSAPTVEPWRCGDCHTTDVKLRGHVDNIRCTRCNAERTGSRPTAGECRAYAESKMR